MVFAVSSYREKNDIWANPEPLGGLVPARLVPGLLLPSAGGFVASPPITATSNIWGSFQPRSFYLLLPYSSQFVSQFAEWALGVCKSSCSHQMQQCQ